MTFSLPRLRRRAFTLLELLVVVVVIGILAALAIVKFGSAQEKAYVATMQSDLRNFATARAIHLSESETPPASVSDVEGYHFSEFVHELGYRSLSAAEWSLSVGHNKSPTACTLSALDLNKTHRITCGEAEAVEFTTLETAPNTVEFDASGAITELAFSSDPELLVALAASPADIESVSWNFGDGASASGTPETHTKVSHTYASVGDYTATLTLVKKSGEVARGKRMVVVATNALSLSPTASPQNSYEGKVVQFTANASDALGGTLTYSWTVGGVPFSTVENPSYTFSTQGTYSVALKVANDRGQSASESLTVTVGPAPTFLYQAGVVDFKNGWEYTYTWTEGTNGDLGMSTGTNSSGQIWRKYYMGYLVTPTSTAPKGIALTTDFQFFSASLNGDDGLVYTFEGEVRAHNAADVGKVVNVCVFSDASWGYIAPAISNGPCGTGAYGTMNDLMQFRNLAFFYR